MARVNLIQLRGGTAAAWTSANPVLELREPGVETDTRRFKFGDGVTAWNSLPYASADSHFLGVYVDETALTTAHADAEEGDYAYVDAGVGTPVEMWIWDDDDEEWIQSGSPAGGTWGSITGTLSAQTDLQNALDAKFSIAQARATRTVTGADAAVQTDDNALIIFNSGSPFNFTLDQLTASSKISFMNIGAGAVTLVAGSGVTITGSVVIPGAVGTEYPSAFVFYHTATTPRVAIGGTESGRVAVAISTGTLTLDINNEIRRDFDLTATETGNFTIAFSNTTNWKDSSLTLRLTGTIAITMPSTVRMENFENTVGRWNTSTRVLTLIGVTASPFEIRFSPQGSIIECFATDRFV